MTISEFRNVMKSLLYVIMLVFFISMFLLISIYTEGVLSFNDKKIEQSKVAVKHSFQIERRFLVEEFMSSSYEALAMRSQRIMKKLGIDQYSLRIVERDECVVSYPDGCSSVSDFQLKGEVFTYEFPVRVLNDYYGTINLNIPEAEFKTHLTLGDNLKLYLLPCVVIVAIFLFWFKYVDKRIIAPYLKKLLAMEKDLAVKKVSRQVAHDIRSPLSALEAISLDNITNTDERQLMLAAISRIKNIANDLLKNDQSRTVQIHNIPLKIKDIIQMKQAEMEEGRSKISVIVNQFNLFSKIDPDLFQRVVCNIINNSLEAFDSDRFGEVKVRVWEHEAKVHISISDNGKGIPRDILENVKQEGFTTKERGHGLGLSSAIAFSERYGGRLDIQSELGRGTEVTLSIPQSETPKWFCSKLNCKFARAIYVDDDPFYRKKFSKSFIPFQNVAMSCFPDLKTIEELDSHFFIDYDLGENLSGFDFIVSRNLQKRSVLVTNMWQDPSLQKKCIEEEVRIMPKALFFDKDMIKTLKDGMELDLKEDKGNLFSIMEKSDEIKMYN